jgi:starch-binding outer membrane protein, SusD/RagB family
MATFITPLRSNRMTRRLPALAVAAALLAGCNADRLNIPNFNEASTDQPVDRPLLQNLASGVLAEQRGGLLGYISNTGVFGRESFLYTSSEPRNTTLFLGAFPLDNSGFTNGQWDPRFRNARNAIALSQTAGAAAFLSDGEKNAVRGFANTMRALDLFYVIATRDSIGIPTAIDVVTNQPQAFVSRDSAYRFISGILDSAATQLSAAGAAAFPFTLPPGFAGFNTPATFRQFNRGLAARVHVYRGSLDCGATCFTAALTALGESFLNAAPGADLRRGIYHTFSTAAGDALNTLSVPVTPDQIAHPSIRTDAQLQANGTRDQRFVTKIRSIPTRNAPGGIAVGIPTDVGFTLYSEQITPLPILRNEELILLRAEANVGLNQFATALTDLNYIRTSAGLLAPIPALASRDAAIDALLYEKRYSLLWEGHRWIDVRRWGRLLTLPLDIPTHFRARVMPVPQSECLARSTLAANLRAPGCP